MKLSYNKLCSIPRQVKVHVLCGPRLVHHDCVAYEVDPIGLQGWFPLQQDGRPIEGASS